MEKWTDELIQGKILYKMGRKGKYKASHTAIENLYNFLPRYLRDRAKKNVEIMFRKGFLIKKITNYGLHVSVNQNPENVKEMNRLKNKFIMSHCSFKRDVHIDEH